MGRDKALLELGGETLIQIGLRTLQSVCAEAAVAGGAANLEPFARVIPDGAGGCGPLGGIVGALEQSTYEWNLFLAVDMPFVPVSALRTLLADAGDNAMVVAAKAQGTVQPLCALYSRRALPILRAELEAGRLKVKDALVMTGAVRYVEFAELDWFRNLNTPDDFQRAAGSERE